MAKRKHENLEHDEMADASILVEDYIEETVEEDVIESPEDDTETVLEFSTASLEEDTREIIKEQGDSIIEEDALDEESLDAPEEPLIEEVDDGRKWYIVQTYSSQEYKVQQRIQQVITEKSLEDKIFRVLVPEEETIEIKNNKRVERVSKIYPGYIFIEAIMSEDIWFEIRRISGVAKIVGTKNAPTPVTEDEILRILRKIGDKTKKIEVDFETGEMIKVISGPFRGYAGPVSEINAERGKLKSLISIFGRETPVELDFNQIEKVVK
jgi:transcriptional antiterminator NusG